MYDWGNGIKYRFLCFPAMRFSILPLCKNISSLGSSVSIYFKTISKHTASTATATEKT